MTKTALNIVLAIALILTVVAYVHQGSEIGTLRSSNEQTLQTVQRQTLLIVDLLKELTELKQEDRFQNFGSEQELRSWVLNWTLTKMPIVLEFLDLSIELRGQTYSKYFDCDDLSEAMQRDALRDSYIMSQALVDGNGRVYGVKVVSFLFENHIGNMAMADSTYWYIEPQLGTITKITLRD